jgi:hypothetical protein
MSRAQLQKFEKWHQQPLTRHSLSFFWLVTVVLEKLLL